MQKKGHFVQNCPMKDGKVQNGREKSEERIHNQVGRNITKSQSKMKKIVNVYELFSQDYLTYRVGIALIETKVSVLMINLEAYKKLTGQG